MIFQCSDCDEYYVGLQCSHCGSVKQGIQPQIRITISESNSSLSQKSISTEYSINSKDMPVELMKSCLEDTEPHVVSNRGVLIHGQTDEQKVWSGTPSPFMIMLVAVQWIPVIFISSIVLAFLSIDFKWEVLLLFFLCVDLVLHSLALTFMKYRLSSQRLEITDGLVHQQIRTYEVHHLADVTINVPFPLGLFGICMLRIRHRYGNPDVSFPLVRIFHSFSYNKVPHDVSLIGLPKEEARLVRDIIRNSGDIEGSRFDKLRVR